MTTLAPLLLGLAFGFVLQRGGLTRFHRVAGAFTFADLTVLKFLLSALATGALTIRALQAVGLAGPIPVTTTYLLGNLVGGMIHGIGMAVSGFCPGTVVAGAGEGRLDNLLFGLPGLLVGALAFGWAWPRFFPALARVGALGRVTFGDLAHVSPWLAALILAEIVFLFLYLVERWPRRRRITGSRPAAS
jgi:uncharacterized membrane protein